MSRMDDLMHAAAESFREYHSPMTPQWLAAHRVTPAEHTELSEEIANAIDSYLVSAAGMRGLTERLAKKFPQPQRVKGLIREQRGEP